MSAPVPSRYEGEGVFRALPRFTRQTDAEFVIGEVYPMAPVEARSRASHDHFFARLHELWLSLPEDEQRFPTEEHLRKWALIKAGYYDQVSMPASSRAEAIRIAAFIRPLDEFSVVIASEGVVTRYSAKSQSQKAMGKTAFQDSKDRVLAIVEDLIGVSGQGAGGANNPAQAA